jgi:hypothetical protein
VTALSLLETVLGPEPQRGGADAGELLCAIAPRTAALPSSIDQAILGGRLADRVGYAFAAGYVAAMRALLGPRARGPTALAATEEGGAHPRAIRTKLTPDGDGFRLDGAKVWTTLAEQAESVVVFANAGETPTPAGPRPVLRAALVPTSRAGIRIERMAEPPFAPEIHHARLTLSSVRVEASELCEGDGYDAYLKPFRTLEDVHVMAAVAAHVVGVAVRFGFDPRLTARLVAGIAGARAIAELDPKAPAAHVAVGGLIDELAEVTAALEPSWDRAPEEIRDRWRRDRGLLQVASRARAERFARAWERLGHPAAR